MKIETIRDNLIRTIAGKQHMLDEMVDNNNTASTAVNNMKILLQINLTELTDILKDVEQYMNHE
jgi:putative IMPACT (imprinted ancient) family translation regulator